ncbi:PAS domain S-box-containing protein [Rhizobium sp. SG_E_25_P2]|uniref:response regulator n=1 Tax=Rhizobium sp. SG_E_25_P2 TaxID=2879942 RepID=UPI002476E336|nr:response regulator [Rhizobium sp. SG_E_25_P2]MDH6264696.1 PAS domain S-box-containing protein [Rhizobium sp. SG_E_25_P2]
MDDAASFDAVLQCNLLEIFCEGLGAALFVTDRLDNIAFASVRLLHYFPMPESAIRPGGRIRDFYAALYEAGCRFGAQQSLKDVSKEDWISDRVATGWKERVDKIEHGPGNRWFHIVSRRFSSGLGLTVLQDVTEHKKRERLWNADKERVRLTEEILDALPIGIAVKDRNLNYAAVNRRFCEFFDLKPERLIGKSVWEVFEPKTASALEEANWRLLSSGDDQKVIIEIHNQQDEATRILHRSRRIGRAGGHYIVMTFETAPEPETVPSMFADASAILDSARDGGGGTAPRPGQSLRVVLATTRSIDEGRYVAGAADLGVELCIVRSPTELSSFLPALEKAGIGLDLILLDESAVHFAPIAAISKTPARVLSSLSALMSDLALFLAARERRQDDVIDAAAASVAQLEQQIDVLAVEDREVNRLALAQILDSLGLVHALAETGQAALAVLAQRQVGLVLADTTLPDMSLTEFMDKGRALAGETPFLAMAPPSAHENTEDLRKAGFLDVAVKPISPEGIDQLLKRHFPPRGKPKNQPFNAAIRARSAR